MAKKKEDKVAQREAYRYSGNPDDMPSEHQDKTMPVVSQSPTFVPSRRAVATEADAMPREYGREKPSAAVSEGVTDKMHLPSMNRGVDAMMREYSQEVPNEAVDTGVYDASQNPAANHEPDVAPPLAKKDIGNASSVEEVHAPSSGSAAPNIFTSGGVRGAFEPTQESASDVSHVNWEEMGRRPIGWSSKGEPVYEWNGYDEDKRPPLTSATEQAYDPVLQGSRGSSVTPRSKDAVFQKDPEKKDGGFMNWLGKLFKGRPGKHEGETDDEYDERMTRNNMRIMTLANAIRHMANLYYTSKGGIPQQFNDPNVELKKGLTERKAERAQKAALEAANRKAAAEQAYKDAQLQLQRDKADVDKNYKNMSLYYKGRDADRADKRFDWEKDKDKWNRNRLSLNDAWKQGFEERKQKATERYQNGRLAVEGKKAKAAMLRATGGGSGSVGNMTNLASPKGHLNRKKELSVYEENQIFNFLKKNGNITSDYMVGWGGMTPEEKRAKIQFAISYAASDPSEKGRKAREYLKKHHAYSETATSAVGGLDFN